MPQDPSEQNTGQEGTSEPEILQDTLQDYKNKKTTIPLPEITLAMHPDAVCFGDDVSDKKQFNERYMESHVHEGMAASILYLAAMWFNVFLFGGIAAIMYQLFNGVLELSDLILLPFAFACGFLPPYIAFKMASPHPIRFNRQAQMIHYPMSNTEVISLPWREAMPYIRMGRVASGSFNLMMVFPDPDNPGDPDNPTVLETSVAFDAMDFTTANGNYRRLEFIRRYMESGLDAIQPCQELIDAGLVRKPTGYDNGLTTFQKSPFTYLISKSVMGIFYWLGTGPLVDRWLRNKVSHFKWPEEVERLCAEGADLSGIDTTPVKAGTERFYEFHGISELIYVDKNRKRIG